MGRAPAGEPRPRNGRPFAWVLILLGGYWLARRLGWQDPGVLYLVGRFWPLLLIVLGCEMLLSRRRKGLGLLVGGLLAAGALAVLSITGKAPLSPASAVVALDEPRGQLTGARVLLETGGSELSLQPMAEPGANLLGGTFSGVGAELDRERSEEAGVATINLEARAERWMRLADQPARWDVLLAPDLPLELTINAQGSTFTINAERLRLSSLDLEADASAGTLILPASGASRVTVEAGAAVLTLVIPEGAAARVTPDLRASKLNASDRFTLEGESYVTPGWETAGELLEITIEGGAASIELR
ncbi:MAG TPA: DUF5668 domain-containing protein [Herpetosiphonaceae bacterium]